jgi:hypothetical protein
MVNINDYLDLRAESNLWKLMAEHGEDLKRTLIYTDFATRINSNSERKLRVIVVTRKFVD